LGRWLCRALTSRNHPGWQPRLRPGKARVSLGYGHADQLPAGGAVPPWASDLVSLVLSRGRPQRAGRQRCRQPGAEAWAQVL